MVKVFSEIAYYFEAKEIFPLQKITKKWKDGSLTIESYVSNHREVIQIIMQWVPYLSILHPKQLKKDVLTKLKQGILKI